MEELDVTKDFSKWRKRLWPFHSSEFKKFLPLILIKFLISINFGILTNMKEAVIITAKGSGAEVISVLKVWIIIPAFIMTILYSRMSCILNKKKLFYTVLGGFLAAIFLYGFVLCPNSELLTPNQSAEWLLQKFGSKYSHWIAVYRHWIHALLFIIAELWGGVIILLMFWGFANDITNVTEAKRSYNIYIAAGDLAAFSIGPIIWLSKSFAQGAPDLFRIQCQLGLTILIGLIVMLIYWWVNKNVIDVESINENHKTTKKEKLSLFEGFRLIARSPYLIGIAILVIGYGLSFGLIEISWKATVKQLFPVTSDYQSFTSIVTSYVGLIAFFASMFFGTNVIRRLGWTFSAQVTPTVVGTTGVLFFLALIFKDKLVFISEFLA